MATRKDILEFGYAMGKHAPKSTQWHRERLLRYGASLNRLAVKQCNEPWTDADETKVERIRANVNGILAEIDCGAVYSRDPRGATLKIVVPDGYTNDWGKEGICVPTS